VLALSRVLLFILVDAPRRRKPWENGFVAIRDYCLSPDGKHTAATVQVKTLDEADVFGFFAGA
jgi:hypothetical protein